MPQFDSSLPKSFVNNFLEANPGGAWQNNEETAALFNPSIQALPLHLPISGQIKKRLNTDMEYYWAFDRNGQNPYHERVEQLRSVGFQIATTKDVEMHIADNVKSETEIRSGDRLLMKVPKKRWMEIRKSQMLQAIMMSNPRGKVMGDNGTVMGVNELLPGIRTSVNDSQVDAMRAKTSVSDASEELQTGKITGNASVVRKGA